MLEKLLQLSPSDFGHLRWAPSARARSSGDRSDAFLLVESSHLPHRFRRQAKRMRQMTQVDEQIYAAHGGLLNGLFLLDREGIVRWAHIEAEERISDFGKAVPEADILAAARSLPQ